jgi:hypothetical protein
LASRKHARREDLVHPVGKRGKQLFTNIYSILSRPGIAYEAGYRTNTGPKGSFHHETNVTAGVRHCAFIAECGDYGARGVVSGQLCAARECREYASQSAGLEERTCA